MSQDKDKATFDLQPSELQTLRALAQSDPPHGQRAQALLSLNQGADLAGAAAQSGLTENQVRYWRGRFRSQGLSVFPGDLVSAHADVPALPRRESPGLLSAPPAAPMLQGLPATEALAPPAAEGAKDKSGKKKGKKKDETKKKKKQKSGKSKKKDKGEKGNKKSSRKKKKNSSKKKKK